MNPTDLNSFLNTADTAAAAWYNGITGGTPVITSTSQAVANQAAINQAAQLQLNQTNPGLAGILANPGFLVLAGLAILGLIVFLVMKK
jgi:hypothetical protein